MGRAILDARGVHRRGYVLPVKGHCICFEWRLGDVGRGDAHGEVETADGVDFDRDRRWIRRCEPGVVGEWCEHGSWVQRGRVCEEDG